MPHCINALILKGAYDKALAETYNLSGIDLGFDLTFFHVDYVYSIYWQHKLGTKGYLDIPNKDDNNYLVFPTETIFAEISRRISNNPNVLFALIQTDYFAGEGNQFAAVYNNETLISKEWNRINQVLKYLGVVKKEGLDEFDTVGLDNIRSMPDFLYEDYADFLDENGLL